MRARDFLIEKLYPIKDGRAVNIVENPSPRKMRAMIGQFGAVRAGMTRDGRLMTWDANSATHDQLGGNWTFEYLLVFFETLGDLEMNSDWNMGKVFVFDGYVFITDSHITKGALARYAVTAGAKAVGMREF